MEKPDQCDGKKNCTNIDCRVYFCHNKVRHRANILPDMSGHSRWTQIKRQKGNADQKRGALYTKIGHTIALAVRQGGKDPTMNATLRLVLEKAKGANMPASTIERAIRRGVGELGDAKTLEQAVYEGFGPGGVALIIEAVTDNKNRTSGDVRHLLTKFGGGLGATGSVEWMFASRGCLQLELTHPTEAQELALIDAGAQDAEESDDGYVVWTKPEELEAVKRKLVQSGFTVKSSDIVLLPKTVATAPESIDTLVEALEEMDEVTRVTTNAATKD